MPSTIITKIFLLVTVLGCSLTATRLFQSGLYKKYPAFTWLFVFWAADLVYPLLLPQNSAAYLYLWITTEPLFRILFVLVVLELFRLILEQYRGLYSLGRWVLYGSSAIAAIISVLTLLPHISAAMPQRTRHLGYVYAFDRGVDLSLVIIILLMLVFLSRFPITLSRNVLVHVTLYSLYFLSSSMYGLVWKMLGLKTYAQVDTVFQGISAACTVAWLFLLTPKGEEIPARRIKFSPEYEVRALGKLEALNQTLLKIGKS